MWEQRHSFPVPERLPSGHRRYSESDVELVLRVLRERAAGLSLAAAIARVRDTEPEPASSIFAGLRRAQRNACTCTVTAFEAAVLPSGSSKWA